jgi:hypothetical protein
VPPAAPEPRPAVLKLRPGRSLAGSASRSLGKGTTHIQIMNLGAVWLVLDLPPLILGGSLAGFVWVCF